ncbi:RNA polymerase sigma factor [Tenacibaculum jejuense]|uniref:RNA polymerase sigma-70 factor n=1 Tax=Tenacibaculum jejuense TaxID=584609 RepID=A0A238UA51_9FLAO|nr:sigma-70 family RNA polymerase sigma factor [Tenacibaculum jejuense]SNR15280.1 RNA polymerase sigma-70 factor [Tenacibaculum jejuense]
MKSTKQFHQKLIRACQKNDKKAQLQLYKSYSKAMFLVAYRYVKDQFLAEDIMQEAFIKAFKNITSYKGEVSFGAWLKKIVINQSIDELKKKKLVMVSINSEIHKVQEENSTWEIDNSVTSQMIIEAINKQKEKYRLVLTLYLLEGYDHKEISEILGITEVTSRTHLMRGKKLIKEHLKFTNHAEGY